MTFDREQIVALSVAPEDAEARAEELRRWLHARRFAVSDPAAVEAFPPNHGSRPGPRPADLIGPGFTGEPTGRNVAGYPAESNIIYVDTPADPDDQLWYYGGHTGPSECRSCGTAFDDGDFWDAFNAWLEGPEPSITCRACGSTALMGDQDVTASIVVSPLAIVLSDAEELVPELLRALRTDFGGRWALVSYLS
ncbi:hypothetical protein ACPEEZ_03280 [Frigoribacterium sp. 2-23]|uniref:hypothetical protein n=1 Tax=Frigoribacterium sp. 2-23 TaxID=3415006 RepID=UPI003C702E19